MEKIARVAWGQSAINSQKKRAVNVTATNERAERAIFV
jgi:hypothetical protein